MSWEILQGECEDHLHNYEDNSFDSVVTDPPYSYNFMGNSWDNLGGGFQAWNSSWGAEALRVLKPGGYALVFGGTRTYHRLVCGLEDAGFEIRDSIMWVYGSGFPKSRDISKAIDSEAGAEREVVGIHRRHGGGKLKSDSMAGELGTASELPLTTPATDAAKQWEGWGTALKPAYEPIVVARKPLAAKHTVAANVLEFGTGGLNIDGCRVDAGGEYFGGGARMASSSTTLGRFGGYTPGPNAPGSPEGRWPPNLLLTHSPDCASTGETRRVRSGDSKVAISKPTEFYGKWSGKVGDHYADADGMETLPVYVCAEGCPVAELDRQSGQSKSRKQPRTERKGGRATNFAMSTSGRTHDDAGGASRFFPVFLYRAKAGRSERPCVDGIKHPTVKPLELIRWLAKLVTPPGGYVLDPFAGSGTTIEAAELEGFSCLGIEREPKYVRLVLERMSKHKKEAA